MTLEVNMVVKNVLEARSYYDKLLFAKINWNTDEKTEMNEMMMVLADTEIRVMNENKDFGLIAPTSPGSSSMWLNLIVDDIDAFFENAVNEGANILSPVQEFPEIPAKNFVFSYKFNHTWVINQKY